MLRLGLADVRTVLCLGAHSDDIEIGCGGTMLKLLSERRDLDVWWVVLGASDRRAEEARCSAGRFLEQARDRQVIVHGFRDSYFPYIGGEIKEFVEGIRDRVSPDLIFTHRQDDRHQDHRLVSELTWCAFRDHLILEYEIPKYDGDLGQPNVFVPLEEQTCGRKIDEIDRCFPSQRDKRWFSKETYWSLLRLRGVECNAPAHFAEAFFARKMTL